MWCARRRVLRDGIAVHRNPGVRRRNVQHVRPRRRTVLRGRRLQLGTDVQRGDVQGMRSDGGAVLSRNSVQRWRTYVSRRDVPRVRRRTGNLHARHDRDANVRALRRSESIVRRSVRVESVDRVHGRGSVRRGHHGIARLWQLRPSNAHVQRVVRLGTVEPVRG